MPPNIWPSDDRAPVTVLVTGGSGYLASWIIATLLKRGFRVRTTLRDLAKTPFVEQMVGAQRWPGNHLAVYAADLGSDAGWAQAVAGCDYLIHTAFPAHEAAGHAEDLMTSALAGTRRVLEAARSVGVRRVVLTSSAGAALPPAGGDVTLDEHCWTVRPDRPAFAYLRAKTAAERLAWDFVSEQGSRLELTTILPGSIQGPALGPNLTGSMRIIAALVSGELRALPRIGFNVVDVRDLADLHVRAMLLPQAAGERFLAASDFLWLRDILDILRTEFPASRASRRRMTVPDFAVRLAAHIRPDLQRIVPQLGVRWRVDGGKAEHVLGWRSRPAAQTVCDAGRSLVEHHLVP